MVNLERKPPLMNRSARATSEGLELGTSFVPSKSKDQVSHQVSRQASKQAGERAGGRAGLKWEFPNELWGGARRGGEGAS